MEEGFHYVLYENENSNGLSLRDEMVLCSCTAVSGSLKRVEGYGFKAGDVVSKQTARREAHFHYLHLTDGNVPIPFIFDFTSLNPDRDNAREFRCFYRQVGLETVNEMLSGELGDLRVD